MVMISGTFCTTEEVQRKTGASLSGTYINSEACINDFTAQAEGLINSATEYNWTDNYAALNDDVKGILKVAESAKAAMMVITYDIDEVGRTTAETMLDVLKDEWNIAITLLKKAAIRGFIQKA